MASGAGPVSGSSVSVAVGASLTTVNRNSTGVASMLPAASSARARKTCSPTASVSAWTIVAQEPYSPSSSAQATVPSLARTANASGPACTGEAGPPSRNVCGAVVSTVNVRSTGLGSTLPTSSVANTASV